VEEEYRGKRVRRGIWRGTGLFGGEKKGRKGFNLSQGLKLERRSLIKRGSRSLEKKNHVRGQKRRYAGLSLQKFVTDRRKLRGEKKRVSGLQLSG